MKNANNHIINNKYFNSQGNQLSIYDHIVDENKSTAKYYLTERNIYGSSVLGTSRDTVNMMNPITLPSYGIMGNRQYQLGEHRGNILAVISDVKYPLSIDNSTIDNYRVGIAQITDYSPFGVELDGRTIQNSKYRYSFQNQEHHDEIKGKGNYMNYKYRGYDPRIGRLDWTLDPLAPKYTELTPYQFSSNRVLDGVELEGLEFSGLNPLNYINQKMNALFSNNFGKNMAKSANDLTKGAAKKTVNAIVDNLDVIATVTTATGYVMYITPAAEFAPLVVKAGEALGTISTSVEIYKDLKNDDYVNSSIKVGVYIVTKGNDKFIDKALSKKLIQKNDKIILKAVNEVYNTSLNQIKISDNTEKNDNGKKNVYQILKNQIDGNKSQIPQGTIPYKLEGENHKSDKKN